MRHIFKQGGVTLQSLRKRRGAIVVLAALMMVMLFGFVALSVDVGMIALTRTRLQKQADAAALAAAQQLSGVDEPATVRANARQAALDVVLANVGGNEAQSYFDSNLDVQFGKQSWNSASQTVTTQWGDQYTPYNVVRVFGRRDTRPVQPDGSALDQRLKLFFAPVLGPDSAAITTSAVASFQPRDIMVVLDFSHSMCYDSQFYHMDLLGKSSIETSLQNIWNDLGSPVYGDLEFTPQYATLNGTHTPHIDVTWKGTSVSVTSAQNITSVRIKYSDNTAKTFAGAGTTGTFVGNGKEIVSCYVLSGSNANLSSGGYGEQFSFTNTNVIKALGLTNVSYPYPSGSWSEFIDYCTGGSQDITDAGYKYTFGAMLWVNYLQDVHGSYSETPDLWKTRELPTAILKSGVSLFTQYLTSMEADDRVGLSVYSTSSGAILEQALTDDVAVVNTITQHRQAGHYDPYTNIGKGMQVARQELEAHARPRSYRLMVVMTDGVVNRPSNATTGTNLVLSEAAAANASQIKIITISMGALADANLMQQVADATGGQNFIVPGGANFATYQEQLLDAFRAIAVGRPLKLVSGN